MTTQDIRIPKLSLFKNEDKLFVNLHEFMAALENLYNRCRDVNANSSTTFVTQELKYVETLPSPILQEMVQTLRDMAYLNQGKETQQKESENLLLNSKSEYRWRKSKNEMKKLVKQYEKEITKLKEYQIACWKSRAKVQKYSLMVDVAQKSLQYHTEDKTDFEKRLVSISGLKTDLALRLKLHSKNMRSYETALEEERGTRQKLIEKTGLFEQEITESIKLKIKNTLRIEGSEDSNEKLDIDSISRCIYKLITRSYSFTEPPANVTSFAFNQPIKGLDEQKNLYDPENTKRIIASQSYIESIGTGANEEDVHSSATDKLGQVQKPANTNEAVETENAVFLDSKAHSSTSRSVESV